MRQKTSPSIPQTTHRIPEADILFVGITVLLPLYVQDHYFNIVEAKARILTLLCLLAWLLMTIACLRTKGNCLRTDRLCMPDVAVVVIAVTATAACCLSEDRLGSFWGAYGWGIGGFVLLSLAALYLFLSRTLILRDWHGYTVVLITAAIAAMTVAHSANLDVFSLHSGIALRHLYSYKATLGNLNAHVGYVCLLFPAGVILFAQEQERKRLCWELGLLIALLAEVVFACTDGAYLGIGLCAFFMIPFLSKEAQRLRRVFLLLAIWGALLLCFGSCPCFADNHALLNGLSAIISNLPVAAALLLTGLTGYGVLRRWPQLWKSKRLRRICTIALELLLALAALYYLISSIVHFSDSWGTGRGKIWRLTLEAYRDLPPLHKLLGIGPEMQQDILVNGWKAGIPVYVSHSELLQTLLTMGLVGAAAWCTIYGSVIVGAVRSREVPRLACAVSVIAYGAQALVNSAMATNLGLLCVILACYRRTLIPRKNLRKNRRNKI